MSAPPVTATTTEHRDSLPESVEIDTTNRMTVRIFQRVAAQMLVHQDVHGAEVRKFARRLAADYLADCKRQAREATRDEFRAWFCRRGDIVSMRSKPRASAAGWAVRS